MSIQDVIEGRRQWHIAVGDASEVLSSMPEKSIQCCVTSPPYWGLRNYGIEGQMGLEKTPAEYVEKLVEVMRQVRRVLRDDGILFLNLGDSYAGSWGNSGHRPERSGKPGHQREKHTTWLKRDGHAGSLKASIPGLKPKDLCGIPWTVAKALQRGGAASPETMNVVSRIRAGLLADYATWEDVPTYTRTAIESLDREWEAAHEGAWWLRSDIIWKKPNPMPESCKDRPTRSYEHIFLLAKKAKYYYDWVAIAEDSQANDASAQRAAYGRYDAETGNAKRDRRTGKPDYLQKKGNNCGGETRNKRDVWTFPTHAYPAAHFATFPPRLPEACIKAGTSERGCCPQCGKPWKRVLKTERKPTRPGEKTKIKQPGRNSRVFQDRDPQHPTERKQRNDYRDPLEIGNRDPERHVTESVTVGWRPQCKCYDELYRSDFQRTRNGRKKYQQDAAKRWFCRVRRRPGPEHWSIEPCITLDPFSGAGTTGLVAQRLGRRHIGIELNPEYAAQSVDRIRKDRPLFQETCLSQNRHKPACVPQNAESDTQQETTNEEKT